MDIVMRQMIMSHELWLHACRMAYGLERGGLVYLATSRFMFLPSIKAEARR